MVNEFNPIYKAGYFSQLARDQTAANTGVGVGLWVNEKTYAKQKLHDAGTRQLF
ncbi:MAG: hypothetical protein IPO01_07265 [Chitinophagaceae bacterium]|nr:hypothetical protein [Chitinophagaceae bacterium]MBK9485006.1 hypothetical protein [Chitinophagaceae bacterium]